MDTVLEKIKSMTEEIIQDSTLFLVDLEMKPVNNIKVFVDGDNGINIDAISKINKVLYKQIGETNLFPENDFSLEVSSPGVDTPLKLYRQYSKNIGRNIHINLLDEREIKGILKKVSQKEITIEQQLSAKQKKAGAQAEMVVPFEQIKTTVVELGF